jgi:hypothetical protein
MQQSADIQLQRRNRRLGLLIAGIVLGLTILCALYITWFGGANKEDAKPFHVERSIDEATRA